MIVLDEKEEKQFLKDTKKLIDENPDIEVALSRAGEDKDGLKTFEELWWLSPSPAVWCEKYQHPLHRLCPVVLNYENLPEPFKSNVSPQHEGKTGDRIQLTPEGCYRCASNIRNGGICDPV